MCFLSYFSMNCSNSPSKHHGSIMTLPIWSHAEKLGDICPLQVSYIQWKQTNVTENSLMSIWKVVWDKNKYKKCFIKTQMHVLWRREMLLLGCERFCFTSKKIFSCHAVSLQASTRLLISQTLRAFWTPRTTQSKVKKSDQGKESTH